MSGWRWYLTFPVVFVVFGVLAFSLPDLFAVVAMPFLLMSIVVLIAARLLAKSSGGDEP